MKISLDRGSKVPFYIQIRDQLREAILSGDMTEGARLPPERRLAAELGVNRTTVVNAYHELAADGLVEARVGRGTIVRWAMDPAGSGVSRPIAWEQQMARGPESYTNFLVQQAADLAAEPGVISFAGGVPAPELYPIEAFRQAANRFFMDAPADVLTNCPAEGYYPLREWVATWLNSQGIQLGPENVLITSGSTQGLDLVNRLLIEPGDPVIVETPTSLSALQLFRVARARLVGIPLDAEGMQVGLLGEALARVRPKFVYTLPTFQNPTGLSLSPGRREEVLRLAGRYGVPIVEDDPYSSLSFEGPPLVPLKAHDRHGYVIYLSTFSKLLFPGLRLGWIAGPRPIIERLALIKRNTDLFTNTLAQGIVAEFLARFDWPAHLSALRAAYRRRRDQMIAALERYPLSGLRWIVPHGGFYVWVGLPDGISAQALLGEAANMRVAFLPGDPFCVDGGGRSHLRLNFSFAPEEQITEGIARLAAALNSLLKRRVSGRTTLSVSTRTIV